MERGVDGKEDWRSSEVRGVKRELKGEEHRVKEVSGRKGQRQERGEGGGG